MAEGRCPLCMNKGRVTFFTENELPQMERNKKSVLPLLTTPNDRIEDG